MDKKKVPAAPAAKQDAHATQDEKRRPINTVRIHDVSGSVWMRDVDTKDGVRRYYSCTFERSYKDRDGTFRYTRTFDRESLAELVAVIQKCDEYINMRLHDEGA